MDHLNFLAQIKVPGQTTSAVSTTSSVFSDSVGWIIDVMPLAIGAFVVVFFSFVLAKIVKTTVVKSLSSHNADDQVVLLVGKVSHIGTLIIGFTIALEILGIDISPVVGLIGLGFGFAMQDIIKNFVCGALILVQEPFRIGDAIKVGEFVGKVEAIESRSTNIKTFDGQRVIVPNADMFSSSVVNFSAHPERRMEVIVGVHYSTDLARASRVVLNVLDSNENILKTPEPKIILSEFADSSINISVKFWLDKDAPIFDIRSDVIAEIKLAFEREGINIPYPIRTLDMPDKDTKKVVSDVQNTKQEVIETPTPAYNNAPINNTPSTQNVYIEADEETNNDNRSFGLAE